MSMRVLIAGLAGMLLQPLVFAQTAVSDLEARGLKPLSGADLRALLPGNTLYHVNAAKGIKVPLFYAQGGKRYVRLRGAVLESAWRIEGERVCEYSVVLKRDVCCSLSRFEGGGAGCDAGRPICDYGLEWAAVNPEGLGQ